MPFSSSQFCSRGLSISQIQRFIPKKWKQPIKQIDIQTNHPYHINESMIDSLVTSLKDLASEGHLFKAFRTFSLIQLHVSSTAYFEFILQPISSLLLSCTSYCLLPQGKQLHAHIIRSGLEQHPILVPKLVTFYSTFNLLDNAYSITENSNILHPLPWNLLISSYVNNGLFKKALSAYREMVDKGIRPDNFTYPSVLKACGEEFDLDFGREVHKSINASSNGWSLFVQNALVSMYGRCGEVSFARYLFDKMPEKDEVSWNTMIATCASKGMWEESIELFESMQLEGVKLNIITLNTIAGGYLRKGNFRGALEFFSLMRTRGSHLDYVAMINGLKACAHIGVVKVGKEIHGFAIRTSCDEFTNVKNALINMYSKCGDLRHAYILFRLVEAKSLITWNTMVSGFTHFDRSEEASFLFREMLLSGVEPNYVTIASLLPLCARVANLQHGKEFHCYIMRHEVFKDYLMLWNSLVDMYARSGKVLEAKRVFDLLSKKDEVTYTSLIAGYGMKGEGQAALELFEEMNRLEINPDHITMAKVLTVCSHSGLVNQGKMLFDKMLSVYGLTPRVEHYSCMVDLFGRAGLIDKAKEIIMRMPCRPTPAMWGTLLGACRIHGNTEIGEWAAEKLLEMRPENSGYYVLIANMYAAAGSWNKLAKVRTYMRDLGVRKAPGRAWVDPGTGFSHFLVGDTSNPHAGQIYPILEGLTELMKEAGYVEGFGSDDEGFEEENTETDQRSTNFHL